MTTLKNTFCDDMRKATRGIHAISDSLVNVKLALGLLQNDVWVDGLLIFYEIFSFLEKTIKTKHDPSFTRFQFLNDLHRVQAFEDDLNFYLGQNWFETYISRESVQKYLNHLCELEKKNPILIIAYIYHLYMGLLNGGTILNKKRQMMSKIKFFRKNNNLSDHRQEDGNRITSFENENINELKRRIRKVTNEIADECSESTRKLLIEESKMVFILNNNVIRTIGGAKTTFFGQKFYLSAIIIIMSIIYLLLM